ncbi:MAG TPA: sigma-70 family RNA polymerase sigma factor [Trebonia sp.]
MRDSELAASIVDGDPRALAEAYGRYADLIWSYCRAVLNDPDNAAEAVTDTFVIAASRLDVLPTFGRLRAWLYAVARNECQRRLRLSKGKAVTEEGERLRRAAKVLSTGEQRQLRALLTMAFGGLGDAERDVMQMVWHGLDLAEVAAVLGITRTDAYALFTRARDQLEASVGVLLIGWSGRGGCDEFEEMLYGRDNKLTPDLRVRLSRHIARCGVCADRYRQQMRPSLMLCLSVGALLSESADARAAASHAPAGLWEQVYQMTSQHNPEARWHKILGSRRVSFGPDGFPKQVAAGRDGIMGRTPLKVAAVGTVAVAATATGWATHGHSAPRSDASTGSMPAVAVAPDASSVAPAASTGAHAGAPSHKTSSGYKAAHAKPPRATAGTPSPASALPVTGSSSVPVASGGNSSSAATPAGSTSGSGSTSSSSSSSSQNSGSGSDSNGKGSGSSSSTTAGTLSVSQNTISIVGLGSGSFTLTAHGGPVNWSISAPSQLLGGVSLSQSSGTLQAGQSVTITVTGKGLAALDEPLTISPGGQTVTVDVSLL